MAKAEWVELSQSSGSGDAAVAVSSKTPYTGREARTSIITWVAEDVEPIERTVIQEGAEVNTSLKGGTIVTTTATRLTITGYSNEAGLAFRKPESNLLPYTVDTELYVAGLKVFRKDGEMTMIPGDPGARQTYRFEIGITINPTGEELPLIGIKGSLAIDGASGKSTLLRIIWAADENKYLIVPEGDIVLDALGTPVTVQVKANTNWVIE